MRGENLKWYKLFKQYITHFYGLLAEQNTRDVGRTREEIVSYEPKASDLQACAHITS